MSPAPRRSATLTASITRAMSLSLLSEAAQKSGRGFHSPPTPVSPACFNLFLFDQLCGQGCVSQSSSSCLSRGAEVEASSPPIASDRDSACDKAAAVRAGKDGYGWQAIDSLADSSMTTAAVSDTRVVVGSVDPDGREVFARCRQ